MTTLNAHVIALDAETGKKVWDQPFGDVRAGESATVAPLIVKDMVIVGSSGGEFGVRGHTDAFKLETGERVWRCYMIPKPGEPGSDTWPADGDAWARGGGNCWITPTYDPDLNLLYYGTGNPCPGPRTGWASSGLPSRPWLSPPSPRPLLTSRDGGSACQ